MLFYRTGHGLDEAVLFEDKQYDFRIPALVYIKEWKTFLAFAEKRKPDKETGTSRDEDAKNLVMRRGTRQPTGTLQVFTYASPLAPEKGVK